MTVTIVQIPQRFMLVNHLSAIDAGVRLLPFVAVMAITSVILSVMMTTTKVPAVFTLIFGVMCEVAGVAGLSQTPTHDGIQASQYGFQILAGAGVGIFNVILLLLTPHIVDQNDLGELYSSLGCARVWLTRDTAVGNGAMNQFRILGGSLGLSIVTCATSPSLRTQLLEVLTPEQTARVLDRTDQILTLPLATQGLVRERFGNMYNMQMIILIGIAAAQLIVTVLQWQRKAIVLKR